MRLRKATKQGFAASKSLLRFWGFTQQGRTSSNEEAQIRSVSRKPTDWAIKKPKFDNFRFGSVAAVPAEYSRMAGLGRLADIQPGQVSGLANSGRRQFLFPSGL